MGYKRKIALVIAVVIIATFLVQAVSPLIQNVYADSTLGKRTAIPASQLPSKIDLPILNTNPSSKVDPRIYEQIENGSSSVSALILFDWHYKGKLLSQLPAGSHLLRYADEVAKYLPILGVSLPADKDAIQALANLPYVKLIAYNTPLSKEMLQMINPEKEREWYLENEKDLPVSINQAFVHNPSYATPYDIAVETQAVELWKMGYTGKGVIIGIMDTGINPRHPDFFFPDGRSKIVYAFSPFKGEDAFSTYDTMTLYVDHGTHVASIAAASGIGSGQGWYLARVGDLSGYFVRGPVNKGEVTGLAPDASLAIFKIFSSPSLREQATIFHIIVSIVQAVKVGVDVMNASWGFIGYDVFDQYFLYYAVAWSIQNGMLWVNSAGNYGSGYVTLGFPAAQESVLTVGVTYPINFPTAGFGGHVVYWSSRGPTYPANSFFQHGTDIIPTAGFLSAGRVKPDVVAPGFGIMAANGGFEIPWPESVTLDASAINFGALYKTLSGTSMAAPVVTGIAALLIQAFPGATPAAIKAALIKGATPVTTITGISDPNIGGAGKVNALNAFNILKQSAKQSGFKLPSPYWTEQAVASPSEFKQIFKGYSILVDNITAAFGDYGTRDKLPMIWDYYNFINDLKQRGANVTYLSDYFPISWVYQTVTQTIESPHPYQPYTNEFYHIYFPGAREVRLHFSKIGLGSTSSTFSYILIYRWDYRLVRSFTGPVSLTNVTVQVPGPGAHVRLVTDGSSAYGFQIDYYLGYLPKPTPGTYSVERSVKLDFYWSKNSTDNIAIVSPSIMIPKNQPYQDAGNYPYIKNEYNAYNLTYSDLLTWFMILSQISSCFLPFIDKGYFLARDLWLPVSSYGFNYTSGFNPFNTTLATVIAADKNGTGKADILYVNATVYDPSTNTYTTEYLNFTVYKPYFRNGNAAVVSNLNDLVYKTVPSLLFGKSPTYNAQFLTGTDSFVWIRITPPKDKWIFVNKTNVLRFWFITNGDGKGSTGINASFIALGSDNLADTSPPINPSIFKLVLFKGTTNKPNALFFGSFDLVMILTPWYVDPDWINRTELKNYVENYFGRILFVGGYLPRFSATGYRDEPIYMLPRGSEVGTPVKMNYYTWEFNVEWVGDVIGGPAKIVATDNPIFAPWIAPDGSLQAPYLYLGSEVMSMKLRKTANTTVWALDPVYPAIVFYNTSLCNGVLMISDSFVLSDVSYQYISEEVQAEIYPYHQWFGLRAVAYLLDPHPPYKLVQQVNQWFYPIGGSANSVVLVDYVTGATYSATLGLYVTVRYDKIVTNGTVWTLNYTIMNTLPYAVSIVARLDVFSNSSISGLLKTSGLSLDTYSIVVPAATKDSQGNVIPSVRSFALGGKAYTKSLVFTAGNITYYPVYTDLWSSIGFNTLVYANLTQTGGLDLTKPIFMHMAKSISVLNKPPRQGDLPLVSTATPSSYDSYTANLIAKSAFDWKYVNITVIAPSPSTSILHAKITGNASALAQFFTITPTGLVMLGTSTDLMPENITSAIPTVASNATLCSTFARLIPICFALPAFEAMYPGLPHTGHYFAGLFVYVSPDLGSGNYVGEVQVFDDNNNLVAHVSLNFTVDQRPNGVIIWDDGLYINNRPAVSDPSDYGFGFPVFTTHTWPFLPWVNAFEFWRTAEKDLNFALKPSGALSISLNIAAQGLLATTPLWEQEQALKNMVNSLLRNTQGFLLMDNMQFRPFDGYYLAVSINYAPQPRIVSYTANEVMTKILAENNGTLIVFAQYGSATRTITPFKLTNPYNMNWLLGYVGSRIYFPVAPGTSAWRMIAPFSEGLPPSGTPLTAGWRGMSIQGIPYSTFSVYFTDYPYMTGSAKRFFDRKLFEDVNSYALPTTQGFNKTQTYSKFTLDKPIATPTPYPPMTTYVWKITVPKADFIVPAFDYIVISKGTRVDVLNSNMQVVQSFVASTRNITLYGVLGAPVAGDTIYVKFSSGAAVYPGFDKGIKMSYVLYSSTVYLDDIAQFYVKNEYPPPAGSELPDLSINVLLRNGIPGNWGVALALDTKPTAINGTIPLKGAKVIAFGMTAWFGNEWFQHAITRLSFQPFIGESRWLFNLRIFMRSIFQYAAGYYTQVTSGMSALESFIAYLNSLITAARNAGMTVSSTVDNAIASALDYLKQAKDQAKIGDYIAAASPLAQANIEAKNAARQLFSELSAQANSAKNQALSTINSAMQFIDKTASYGVDVSDAKNKLSSARESFSSANSTLASVSSDPATWGALITAYTGFKASLSAAQDALKTAANSAYSLATMLRGQALDALNKVKSMADQLAANGIPYSDETLTLYNAASAKFSNGDSELALFNLADATTYQHALNAITSYKDALGLTSDASSSLLKDARNAAAARISDLKATIAKVKAGPHDASIVDQYAARVPYLESQLASATKLSEFISIYKTASDYINIVNAAVITTTPVSPLQLAAIIILILILIFVIIYAIARRRRTTAVL